MSGFRNDWLSFQDNITFILSLSFSIHSGFRASNLVNYVSVNQSETPQQPVAQSTANIGSLPKPVGEATIEKEADIDYPLPHQNHLV